MALVGKEKNSPGGGVVGGTGVNVWKKTLNLEWWRYKLETRAQEVNELQRAWLENEEKQTRGETQRKQASKRAASMAFKIDNIEEDELPSSFQGAANENDQRGAQSNFVWGA